MIRPNVTWQWTGSASQAVAATVGIRADQVASLTETAMNDIAQGAQAEVLKYTPGPGVQEVERTWKRTGQLRRTIRAFVNRTGNTVSLVIDANVPYDRWIEEGFRDTKNGRVFMKVRPGGYRMFQRGREYMAGDVVRERLAQVIRDSWAGKMK